MTIIKTSIVYTKQPIPNPSIASIPITKRTQFKAPSYIASFIAIQDKALYPYIYKLNDKDNEEDFLIAA